MPSHESKRVLSVLRYKSFRPQKCRKLKYFDMFVQSVKLVQVELNAIRFHVSVISTIFYQTCRKCRL